MPRWLARRHYARCEARFERDADGGEYFTHRLIDDGPKPNGRPTRRRRPAAVKPSDASGGGGLTGDGPQDKTPAADADDRPGSLSDADASARDKTNGLTC